jgi:flavin reductase (DIM6/NTAB) family NADH-FMN oxidoreductase RutF
VICVNRDAEAHDPICRVRAVSVNVLSVAQQSTARIFGGLESLRGPLRFEQAAWTRSVGGLPMLEGSLASFDCDVETIADGKTHSILICTVRAVSVERGAGPLVYWERDFHRLAAALP